MIPNRKFYSVADNAHVLFGYAIIVTVRLFSTVGWLHAIGMAAAIFILYAAVKEGVYDNIFEGKAERGSGWRDFAGYFGGCAVGVVVCLIAMKIHG